MSGFEVTQVDDGYTVTTVNDELNELINGAVFWKKEVTSSLIPTFHKTYYKTVVRFMGQDVEISITNSIVKFNYTHRKDRFDVFISKFSRSQMEALLNSGDSPAKPDMQILVDIPGHDKLLLVVYYDPVRRSSYAISINCAPSPYYVDIDLDIPFENGYYEYSSGPKIQAIEDLLAMVQRSPGVLQSFD
jgi:hypothetical protein